MRSPLIEFRNDGVTDSLTKSPAPAIFLSALENEFQSAVRDKRALTIISFVSKSPSTIHADISALARALKKSCRKSEPFSRISEDGFWVLIRSGHESAEHFIERVYSEPELFLMEPVTRWHSKIIEHKPDESLENWIARIDKVHFQW